MRLLLSIENLAQVEFSSRKSFFTEIGVQLYRKEDVMETRIVIRQSKNTLPEDEIEDAIASLLAEGFRVKSANTSIAPFGEMSDEPYHLYYAVTVVLERD